MVSCDTEIISDSPSDEIVIFAFLGSYVVLAAQVIVTLTHSSLASPFAGETVSQLSEEVAVQALLQEKVMVSELPASLNVKLFCPVNVRNGDFWQDENARRRV